MTISNGKRKPKTYVYGLFYVGGGAWGTDDLLSLHSNKRKAQYALKRELTLLSDTRDYSIKTLEVN